MCITTIPPSPVLYAISAVNTSSVAAALAVVISVVIAALLAVGAGVAIYLIVKKPWRKTEVTPATPVPLQRLLILVNDPWLPIAT